MQISLLSQAEADAILTYPHEYGRRKRLMGFEYKAKGLQDLKNYGCRHCFQIRVPNNTSNASGESKPALYNFNGMRSHLKEKYVCGNFVTCHNLIWTLSRHGIKDIRDEDFLCLQKLDWEATKSELQKYC